LQLPEGPGDLIPDQFLHIGFRRTALARFAAAYRRHGGAEVGKRSRTSATLL